MSLRHLDEYRAPEVVRALLHGLSERAARRPLRFMEICGTHTVALFRTGPCARAW